MTCDVNTIDHEGSVLDIDAYTYRDVRTKFMARRSIIGNLQPLQGE